MRFNERFKQMMMLRTDRRRNPRSRSAEVEPDDVSPVLRTQIMLLFRRFTYGDALRSPSSLGGDDAYTFWAQIHASLCDHIGAVRLVDSVHNNPMEEVYDYLNRCDPTAFLDFIELGFRVPLARWVIDDVDDLISAINIQFDRNGSRYELSSFIIDMPDAVGRDTTSYSMMPASLDSVTSVPIASYPQIIDDRDTAMRREIIDPALTVLTDQRFIEANRHFMAALSHQREGRYEEAISEAKNTVESTLKVLWLHAGKTDPDRQKMSGLSDHMIEHLDLQPFFKNYPILLSSLRNTLGDNHGRASSQVPATRDLARFATAQAASIITLIITKTD